MYHTFLAANSCSGFYSLFDEMTKKTDHNIILIKGGPGTGKSSLMRRVAAAAEEKGLRVEGMHCSSDPDSLDGVFVEDKKLILLDATAPHLTDPVYPGAVEQILPLGEYWDRAALKEHRRDIIRLSRNISDIFKRVYRLLGAAGQLRAMSREILSPAFDREGAEALMTKFFRRQAILPRDKKAHTQRRFLSALSGKGEILFTDLAAQSKYILLIEDHLDTAHWLTALIDRKLEEAGYDRTQYLCPLEPQRIDHLWVPELSLAVLTQSQRLLWPPLSPVKTVHMRQLLDGEVLASHKNKLNFARKMCKSLYEAVSELLQSEKALHDELEQYYVKAMDFERMEKDTEHWIRELL